MINPILISDKVCVVGGSLGRDATRMYTNQDWNIWCVANIYNYVPYATLVFDMHQDPKHWTFNTELAHQHKKLILQTEHPSFPDAYIIPTKEIVNEFGNVFTSSFSWIVAYALYCGVKTLSLCGVNMSHESELESQRPGLFYLLGYARATGFK